MTTCVFNKAWIGPCGDEADASGFCATHRGLKCVSCKKQATRECDEAGSLVCGYPLCDDCTGFQDRRGDYKDWHGFVGSGVHSHTTKEKLAKLHKDKYGFVVDKEK